MAADIDTSANHDPSPTAAELLAIRDRALEIHPLSDAELQTAQTIVWVGTLACGCRPFAIVDTLSAGPSEALDDAFGYLLGHAAEVEAYSLDAVLTGQIVQPCTHNVASDRAT